MKIDQMLVILLPVVLFFINLMIIIVLRESDNRKKGITNIKKLTDRYKTELENHSNDFRSEVADIENRIAKNDSQLKELIQTATAEINNIKTYCDDMATLRHSMDTYREALAGLAKLTTDADTKIAQVENDLQRLESVKNMIDTFKLDMKDADEHLKQHENTVIQLQKDTISQLEDSLSAFKIQAEKTLEETKTTVIQYNEALEEKVDSAKAVTNKLQESSIELLDSLGDRSADQKLLADQIEELTRSRNELSKDLSELNRQVEEKRSFAAQLDDVAREENMRLNRLKESIKMYEPEKASDVEKDSADSDADYSSDYRNSSYMEEAKQEAESSAEIAEPSEAEISEVPEAESTEDVAEEDTKEDAVSDFENTENEIIIENESSPKVEYYGKEEEIVF